MFDGTFVDYTFMHPNIRAYPQQPQETSGVYPASKTYTRYSLRDSDYPTLIIVDPISDNDGDIIQPGYYELALSDAQDFLLKIKQFIQGYSNEIIFKKLDESYGHTIQINY